MTSNSNGNFTQIGLISVLHPANLDSQGLVFWYSCKTQERFARGTIPDAAMRSVVIVLLDPASDAAPCFFQAPILRRPDFLFFQTAMEPFDVAVAFRVMIRRPPMGDAEPPQRLQEA